ncbi:unnamed protein product, partial [Angiostrongylus costaricensis]|uniref:Laminin EGF-like domain-containing protein n=1 Tax=Angiostrongylus costaricensis TaxID=334426 RepID=A0A0R3PXL1_ANGCS
YCGLIIFCLVISITVVLSYGDCGCGSKCANYTGPSKCTRCCTAIVKRSLDSFPRRAHRFLLPTSDDQIRKLIWATNTRGISLPLIIVPTICRI